MQKRPHAVDRAIEGQTEVTDKIWFIETCKFVSVRRFGKANCALLTTKNIKCFQLINFYIHLKYL